jgi:hypothetical protein
MKFTSQSYETKPAASEPTLVCGERPELIFTMQAEDCPEWVADFANPLSFCDF